QQQRRRSTRSFRHRIAPQQLADQWLQTPPVSAYTPSVSGRSTNRQKVVAQQQPSLIRGPDALILFEKSGLSPLAISRCGRHGRMLLRCYRNEITLSSQGAFPCSSLRSVA